MSARMTRCSRSKRTTTAGTEVCRHFRCRSSIAARRQLSLDCCFGLLAFSMFQEFFAVIDRVLRQLVRLVVITFFVVIGFGEQRLGLLQMVDRLAHLIRLARQRNRLDLSE